MYCIAVRHIHTSICDLIYFLPVQSKFLQLRGLLVCVPNCIWNSILTLKVYWEDIYCIDFIKRSFLHRRKKTRHTNFVHDLSQHNCLLWYFKNVERRIIMYHQQNNNALHIKLYNTIINEYRFVRCLSSSLFRFISKLYQFIRVCRQKLVTFRKFRGWALNSQIWAIVLLGLLIISWGSLAVWWRQQSHAHQNVICPLLAFVLNHLFARNLM